MTFDFSFGWLGWTYLYRRARPPDRARFIWSLAAGVMLGGKI